MINNIEKFEMMARGYDNEVRVADSKVIVEEVVKHLNNTSNLVLLDYGCGTGLIGLSISGYFKEVILVDPAQSMVDVVNEKISTNNIKNARSEYLDVSLEKLDYKVDYIIIVQTLLHIDDYEKVLKNLSDCLNQNGHLIIVDFDKNEDIVTNDVHNGFVKDELVSYLETIGFSKVYCDTFYFKEKIFMKQDASQFIIDMKKQQ